MSLAVGGGGMGGGAHGGLVMGHNTAGAGPPGAPQAPPTVAGTGHGPPPLMVGVDMCDKQQKLSIKQVRNVAHLPICAIDLFAESPIVAMFPPKPKDPTDFIVPRLVGKMKSGVAFKVDSTENNGSSSGSSHKTLRKWLTKSRSFEALQADSLTKFEKKSSSSGGTATAVLIDKPYAWMGLRRLDDAPDFLKSSVETDNVITPAIAEEVLELKNPGTCLWTNSTLDGSPPQGDDFDRVVAKLRLHPTKKALTILPEEATQILFHQAQHHVASKLPAPLEDADEIENMPIAVALPAWACRDAVIEAMYDATPGSGSNSTFFPRSVCALAGALLKGPDGQLNDLHSRIDVVRASMMKEFEKEFVKDKSATVKNFVFVLLGMTGASTDGLECTALEITSIRSDAHPSVPISGVKVLANVSYQSSDPLSKLEQSVLELQGILDEIAPEAALPGVLVPYGCSTAEQDKIAKKFHAVIAKDNEWANTPFIITHPEAVAMGAALLAGACHGRILKHTENKKKLDLAMRTQLVAPVAVGVSFDYYGAKTKTSADDDANGRSSSNKNQTKHDVPVKIIFDFDRRIPAGPYIMEFKASECVVYRKDGGADLDDDAFLKAVKEVEGTKGIPMREEAALNLRVQVYEKWTRDGEWKPLGDPQWPLVRIVPGDDDNDKTSEKREACENVSLELSLAVTGMVTSALIGERESVVQALKTSRKNAFYYYLGLGMAILFFGGFFVKSWYEEYTLKRDTARLLAFYKHVLPGSIHDGDHRSAQWVAYKYRHKKKKLWASLEKKYGFKVLQPHEWGDGPQPGTAFKNNGDEDETVNLDDDDDDDPKDPLKGVDGDEPDLKDEPDL